MPLTLFRYLAREVCLVMLAVTGVVLLILMSGRFVNYLAKAASGSLSANILFSIMGYRIPGFLVMIIPLGLLLGIIMAYGRLYVENEMSVISACGVSRSQLLAMTLAPAIPVMMVVALFSLNVTPWGMKQVETILAQQKSMNEFDTLVPGRFQRLDNGERSTYTENLSKDRKTMYNVFIANPSEENSNTGISLVLAQSGHISNTKNNLRYLTLNNGTRYDLSPGSLKVKAIHYQTYGIRMEENPVTKEISEEQALPTSVLLDSKQLSHKTELQWRISLPLIIPIIVLLAFPLSRVSPRQGRFLKILPAVLLYLTYVSLLIASKGLVEAGRLPPTIGLWWVHTLFLVLGLFLYFKDTIQMRFARRTAHA